tara:strand:- start:7143 stop:7247 length:105 start_codon:yes stop_codon:yes gene_type:complete
MTNKEKFEHVCTCCFLAVLILGLPFAIAIAQAFE